MTGAMSPCAGWALPTMAGKPQSRCRDWRLSRGPPRRVRGKRGFDEIGLPVAHSDIDFALKLRVRGLKILWTPSITLRHYESKTRGRDHLDPEKWARSVAELKLLEQRWARHWRWIRASTPTGTQWIRASTRPGTLRPRRLT